MSDAAQTRWKLVKQRSKSWSGQLVDLSGRNNLLYYRDLKVGTLPLDNADHTLLFEALAGKSVTLSRLFKDPDRLEDALKRARTVRNKANAHEEERGLKTLYLALGMAKWTGQKSASQPAAPVLLVPARLAPRGAAQEEFELSVTEDPEVNPTLLQMLKAEYEVSCDPEELLASGGIEGIIDTPEELNVTYEWLRQKCSSVPGFAIDDRYVIGNFSYAKLPMVHDLERSLEAMAEHDLIAALAGDAAAQEELRQAGAGTEILAPDFTPPSDEFLVLDADASQNYAINAVLSGRSLIIKGPPGTGKSQTISNLISTLVARGKRVLFVAEKRAAIEAVLTRLDRVGLSDLVLDLHGGVGSKRQTAQELAKALATNARLQSPELSAIHIKLEQRRSQLTGRVDALHKERQPWGVTFYGVQSRLLALPGEARTDLRFRGATLESLSEPSFEEAAEKLDRYVGLGGLGLSRSGSPWASATVVSPEEAQAFQARVEALRAGLDQLLIRLRSAAAETQLPEPGSFSGWSELVELWSGAGRLAGTFGPEVYGLDLPRLLDEAEALTRSAPARFGAAITDSAYRQARDQLRGCLVDGVSLRPGELHAAATEASALLARWTAARSGEGGPMPCAGVENLATAFTTTREELVQLAADLGTAPDDSVGETADLLTALLADISTLGKLPELHRLRTALDAKQLQPLVAELEPHDVTSERARQLFAFAWLSSIREHLLLSDQVLGAFDGDQHRQVVEEFQAADRQHIETTAQRVRRMCAEQATAAQDADEQGAALIRAEAAKKRKHLPIRQLFSAAPEVMTSLKPCWVMSPLVVSQLLPSDQPHFDVVVFDEASQVRPAEAIPAILRGRQLVVAGDERQLPPSNFFSGSNLESEEEEAEIEAALAIDSSFESILEAMAPFVDSRMLQWHYRSRDERLIAFSNVHLYDRGLTTFPGVVGPDCIQHVLTPFEPGEPGSQVSSVAEVRRVVELVLEHAELRPDQSLGVIAMGIKHAERVDEALREVLSNRPDLDPFFDESQEERFFIKNLERVQGDERDAIILSVGYGKSPDGRLPYRFGPLNQEGGERRLNVAVTRAKERMTLVSSFSHLDMDPDRSTSRGVELLRAYLEYCASHGTDLGPVAASIPELNPFEVDIRDWLERAGLQLSPQFGSSGYRIDFAAKHPAEPGRMVLAIECDGASYHSSPSARDRDRLRQEQLERLGWTFHRIWSQDWFNDREGETERTLAAYSKALAALENDSGPDAVAEPSLSDVVDQQLDPVVQEPAAPRSGPCPVLIVPAQPIDNYRPEELVALIRWINSDGLLRTKAELRDEVIRELGFRRRGTRIIAAVDAAMTRASA